MRPLLPLVLAAGLTTPLASGHAQPLPTWVQWLVTSGHAIEDGRACGLVDPNEVEDMYMAVLMVSKVADNIAPAQSEKVLRVAQDHARDEPVTPVVCGEARDALPQLRAVLAPYMAAVRKTR